MAPEERPFSLNICICIINHYRLQVSGCVYCLVIITHYHLHIDIQSYLNCILTITNIGPRVINKYATSRLIAAVS